jgi:hypothetical protein
LASFRIAITFRAKNPKIVITQAKLRTMALVHDARKREERVPTRPSSVMAQEFLADSNWKTLPERLDRLVRSLESWVRRYV